MKHLSVYTRATIIGFVLTVLALLIGTIINLIESNPETLVFTIPSMAIPIIVAGLVWRFGRWALVVAVIIALLSFLLNSFYIPYGLGNPNSFFDFLPALLVVFGFILTFFGRIAAFVQRRAETPRTTATIQERGSLAAIGVVISVLAIVSLVLNLAAQDTVSAEQKAGATEVVMQNLRFVPDRLELSSTKGSRLVVRNNDFLAHTFTVKDADADVTIGAKGEKLVELSPLAPETYELTCEVPGHENMEGLIEIKG